jgi:PAS domain S-box-containing protein
VFVLCAVLIGLGIFVVLHDRRAKVNKLFALSVFTIAGWIVSISMALSMSDLYRTILLGRLAFAFASAIPFSLLWMFQAFPVPRPITRKRETIIPAVFASAFIAFSLSPWIVAGAKLGVHRPNFIYGPLHPFFGVYFLLSFGFALYTLWRKTRSASGIVKLQLRYLLLGLLITGAGAITTNLLIPLVWKTSRFSVLGPYFTLALAFSSAHAIIRYRLMDIKVVIQKGVVYVCAIGVAASIFIGLVNLLRYITAYDKASIPLGAAVALAVMVAIFFQPLKSWIQDSLNRYLYRQTYDYRRTVREASQRLSAILDLQSLLDYIAGIIAKTLKVEMVAVYVRDHLQQGFAPRVFQWPTGWEPAPSGSLLPGTSPLVAFLERERQTLVSDDASRGSADLPLTVAARELRTLGGDLAFPFFQDHTVSGILVVGPKLSGDPYFAEDIELLSTLVSQAGIAIKNAQLYREVTLANEYIENILATMESGVIAVSGERRITLYNHAAERLTGRSAGDLRSGPLERLPAALAAQLEATLADGQPRLQVEIILPDAAGRLIPMACSTSALRDNAGQVHGAVVVFSDLTRLKALEGEKRRAERLAAFGALASGIAHEIKNPLVAIKTFAELIPERYTDVDFRENFSKVAIKEIKRIDGLVARLRGLAAPEQILRPLDIRGPIEETLTLLAGQLEQKRITVRRLYAEPVPLVEADEPSMKQLFLNLFMNSLDAMADGGELTVRLTRRFRYGAPTLLAEVSDTGSGIPEAMLDKIFDPFVTTKAGGSGLGLAICRGIADSHGAAIRAENNSERPGATIGIEFPVAVSAPIAVAP